MNGFLEEIVELYGGSGPSGKYNQEFFSKYINHEEVTDLLKVSNTYFEVINILNNRHDKKDTITIEKLDKQLKSIVEEINLIGDSQVELCGYKSDNVFARENIYRTRNLNLRKIKDLTKLDGCLDAVLARNDKKIEGALIEKENITNQIENIINKRNNLDQAIEGKINLLKILFDGKTKDYGNAFKGINIDILKDQYDQGLINVIENTIARKAYSNYFFDLLRKEINLLPQICENAQQFILNAQQENGFEVEKLIVKNDQAVLNKSITSLTYDGLRQFADSWCSRATDKDEQIAAIGDSYLISQLFIDDMYDYVANLNAYAENKTKGEEDYNKLAVSNEKLYYKITNRERRVYQDLTTVNRILKEDSFYNLMEKEPSELAFRIFDNFKTTLAEIRTPLFDNEKKQEKVYNKTTRVYNEALELNNEPVRIYNEPTHESSGKQSTNEKPKVYTYKMVADTKGIADINQDFKIAGDAEFKIPSGKMR